VPPASVFNPNISATQRTENFIPPSVISHGRDRS
jgi:hypothetical protein